MKNLVWVLKNNKALILAYQLAYKNGKQEGSKDLSEEFIEVHKRHPDWLDFLGATDKDSDMLTGDLREQGVKVLNINEVERQQKLDTRQ